MADEGSISHAAGDVFGLVLLGVAANYLLKGAKKVSNKLIKKDKDDIDWFS